MSNILGIDYGNVRVGYSIADEILQVVTSLDTYVINNSDKLFLNKTMQIVKENNVSKIIIGYPKNMDGTISKKAEKIDILIEKLQKLINVDIIKYDERLTTKMAYSTMRELNISQKKKNTYADKIAAIYILEGYLEFFRNQNK